MTRFLRAHGTCDQESSVEGAIRVDTAGDDGSYLAVMTRTALGGDQACLLWMLV